MIGLPLVTRTAIFKTTGYSDVTSLYAEIPLTRIPSRWDLQVTGLAADGKTLVTPSAWAVYALRSLDNLGWDDYAHAMVSHVSGTNAIGAVQSTDANMRGAAWIKLYCQTLTLGSADHILVNLIGHL